MPLTLTCLLLLLAAEPDAADPRVESLWRLHYPRYAAQCLPFEDGCVCVPGYDRRYPSTRHVTTAQAVRELTIHYEQDFGGGMSRPLTRRPDDAEVAAYVETLPGLEVGHYGHIDAVRVDDILGAEEMTIKAIRLIDDDALDEQIDAERERLEGEDRKLVGAYLQWKFSHRIAMAEQQEDRAYHQPMRLVGFSTVGLRSRQAWTGPSERGLDVAVVKLESYGDKGDKQRLVLMPREKLRDIGIDEDQFLELLAARGLDKAGFVSLVRQMHAEQRDRELAERQVFLHLLVIDPPTDASPPASRDAAAGKTED